VELDENQAPGRNMAIQAVKEKQIWITTDHSMHEILQKQFVRFATPQRCAAIAEHTVAPGKEKNLKKVPSRLWRY
jgi:hypothetical protein